jgi:hypothetical protein
VKKKPVEEPKVIIRKTTEYLRCPFTQEELAEKAEELALQTSRLNDLDGERSQVAADFGARIKESKARIARLANDVSSKHEMRNVPCEWHMNVPKQGRKTLVRVDSQAIVREEQMIDSDCQQTLPLGADEGKGMDAEVEHGGEDDAEA